MDGGTPALLERLADPQRSAALVAELTDDLGEKFWPERIVIASTPDGPYQSFVGRSVTDFATAHGLGPAEGTLELLRGQGGRVAIIHHSMSEDDVRHVMSDLIVSVASDGATLQCPGDGRPHPRSLGTFVRVLGHYVRDENVLALPDAVRKMTSQPASRLGWTDRGVVRPGAIADLAVFDPDEVADQATFEDPWQLATGVRYTLLAGVPVLDDGAPTNAAAGAVIRHG
jgi:N-acyl-D-amino-acid deacylase